MARAKRAAADKLADTINQILTEYGDDIQELTTTAVQDVTKAAVKAVKANSRAYFGGTGKYAKGWTSQVETGRTSAQGTIYNGSVPGLPHLLEKGHAKRGGGRTQGVEHIAPVEEQVVEQFRKVLEEKI